MFHPGLSFNVTNFYNDNVIALGQENIRSNSYSIKPEDMEAMIASNKSIIIELIEC